MLRPLAALVLAVLSVPSAHAAPEVHRVTWSLRLDGQEVGQRDATFTVEREGDDLRRSIEAHTKVAATIGPVSWRYEQKLTANGLVGPLAFRAVIVEDGAPREVQGRWAPSAWTIALADARSQRAYEAAAHRVDLSTVDLLDPFAARTLGRYATLKVLSAETGEILEGTVEPLGGGTVRIGGRDVPVQGWAWTSSLGRSQFWYDGEGWLVKFETALLGRLVEGVLTAPPPSSPDSIVPPSAPAVVSEEL